MATWVGRGRGRIRATSFNSPTHQKLPIAYCRNDIGDISYTS